VSWFRGLAPLVVFAGVACGPDTISLGYDEPVVNQGALPNGAVSSCYGSGCPYGECSNDEFTSDVDCDDAYPGPIDDSSLFCEPGEEGDYCLEMGSDPFLVNYWAVHCGGGVATATHCGSGCLAESPGAVRCL
jgi:hypothetical protein